MAALADRLRFRAALWWQARVLPARVRNRPLEVVVALARGAPAAHLRDLPVDYILKRVRRTVRRPWLMRDRRCLREGLLACRFLTAAGHAPELHFGVDRASAKTPHLQAHCWVVKDGAVVLNPPDPNMVPIYVHRP